MSAVNFLTSGIGKFWSLNWEKSTVFGIGNGTLYRHQLYKEKNRCNTIKCTFLRKIESIICTCITIEDRSVIWWVCIYQLLKNLAWYFHRFKANDCLLFTSLLIHGDVTFCNTCTCITCNSEAFWFHFFSRSIRYKFISFMFYFQGIIL